MLSKKDKQVAFSVITDHSFGVSVSDLVDFANKYEGSHEYCCQEVIYDTLRFIKKMRPVCIDLLINNDINPQAVEKRIEELAEPERKIYIQGIVDSW